MRHRPDRPDPSTLASIWEDQKEFNGQLRMSWQKAMDNGLTDRELDGMRAQYCNEFGLGMMSEIAEFLKRLPYRKHRSIKVPLDREAVKEELTDIFKYLISMCLEFQITPEEMIEWYWKKSAICRLRQTQEFCLTLTPGSAIVVDIDNVLAQYTVGLASWLGHQGYSGARGTATEWITSSTLGVSPQTYEMLIRKFRIEGGKKYLPVMEGAADFLDRWKDHHHKKIILLTSRPIDIYPCILADTMEWLDDNHLQYDAIWWGFNKGDKILNETVAENILFAVDDDAGHCQRIASLGIKTFYFNPHDVHRPGTRDQAKNINNPDRHANNIYPISTLSQIEEHVNV